MRKRCLPRTRHNVTHSPVWRGIRETLLFLAVSVSKASLWRRRDGSVVGRSRGCATVFVLGSEDRFRSHERWPSSIFNYHLYSWHRGGWCCLVIIEQKKKLRVIATSPEWMIFGLSKR